MGEYPAAGRRPDGETRHAMATASDPVCGMQVEMGGDALTYEYEDTVYYFCGKGCLLEFKDDPEKYLDPAYEPQGM